MSPEKLFAALADRTRLRLLNLMRQGEVCVCFFVEVVDAPQPTISRHLAYLRKAGIVDARRDGKWMHYSISGGLPPRERALLLESLELLKDDRQFQRDRDALSRACCSPRAPEILRRAPKPSTPK
jgi:ArsR family transcriptional regulator